MVSELVQHCPKLRSLRLHNATGDALAALTRNGQADDFVARLEELESVQPTDYKRRRVAAFVSQLADPLNWLAQSLHTLVISKTMGQEDSILVLDKEAAMELKHVLETNQTLRTVRVWLSSKVPVELATALVSHTSDPVAGEGEDERAARKRAFLSVVGHYTKQNGSLSQQVLDKLDAKMLGQIFAFSGPMTTRVVRAEYQACGTKKVRVLVESSF